MVITACSFPARLPQGGETVAHRAVRAPLAGRPACRVHPASRRGRSRRVVRRASTCPESPGRAAPTRRAPPQYRLPEFLRSRDRSAWVCLSCARSAPVGLCLGGEKGKNLFRGFFLRAV